jgi:hypothetical protein
VNGVVQIKMRDELGYIGGVRVHLVAHYSLRRPAMTAAVVRDRGPSQGPRANRQTQSKEHKPAQRQ